MVSQVLWHHQINADSQRPEEPLAVMQKQCGLAVRLDARQDFQISPLRWLINSVLRTKEKKLLLICTGETITSRMDRSKMA
jgi:hypothetical protein